MTRPHRSATAHRPPDFDETKDHVLAAGREILLAAQGALRFCRDYAEEHASPSARSQMTQFFSKAIAIADDLGGSIVRASTLAKAAKGAARPLFDAMSREMRCEERAQRRQKVKAARPKAAARRRRPRKG